MDAQPAAEILRSETALNLVFVVIAAAMVIFMQAGFALLETGFCRARNAVHVLLTNVAIFGVSTVGFMAVGFALMFGATTAESLGHTTAIGDLIEIAGVPGLGVIARAPLFLGGATGAGILGLFTYQLGFMDTAATIPTGAMAERWKFSAFIWWGLFCSTVYYPVYGLWVWGGGWLSQLGNTLGLGHGVVDFAGSGVVHGMGGIAGLVGAMLLGPRAGKFAEDGTPVALPGHHIPIAILGSFILLFGWFGFNSASALNATDLRFALVAANTVIAAASGLTAAMLWVWRRFGSPDPSMTANGMLAGLVAITASCAFVSPWAAMVIGATAGIIVVEAVWFIERWLLVDDPVGAVAVHFVCGIYGVLAVGIFANGTYGDGLNGVPGGVTGLLYGDVGQFIAQLFACFTVCVFGGGMAYTFFRVQDRLVGIRSLPEHEAVGLDLPEIGAHAYPELQIDAPASSSQHHPATAGDHHAGAT